MPSKKIAKKWVSFEKDLRAEIKGLRKMQKAKIKTGGDRYTKEESIFRSRIGKDVFDSAFNRYPRNYIDAAIQGFAKAERAKVEKQQERLRAYRERAFEKGLEPADIARHLRRKAKIPGVKVPQFFPISRGRHKGKFEKVDIKGKTVGYFKRPEALRQMRHYRYQERIKRIAKGLDLTTREAKSLYSETRKAGLRALSAFKKTATYKGLKPRQKKGMTTKRFVHGTYYALFRMLDIELSG